VRRRFGRLALAVGALAVIVAWIARQRKAADTIRESYETARKRFEEARELLSERVQERGQEAGEEPARGTEEAEEREEREGTEGHRAYFRKVIEESNKRASGQT
jgi:C4-dicarboxylate-specific signal transduction histidine kinase